MTIEFPTTKDVKDAIRDAIGQTVTFVLEGVVTPCPTCSGISLVVPDDYSDPDSAWTNETNAYDEDTDTFAMVGWLDQGKYLELTLTSEILCNKVRIYAASCNNAGTPYDPDIDVDVFYDSDWHTINSGVITKQSWDGISIPDGIKAVTKVRIAWDSLSYLWTGRLYEVRFEEVIDKYDPVNKVSLDPFCPTCSGAYWIVSDVEENVTAHVRWRTGDESDFGVAGETLTGDCFITIDIDSLSEDQIVKIKEVRADSRKLKIYRTIKRGVPTRDRIRFVCREVGKE